MQVEWASLHILESAAQLHLQGPKHHVQKQIGFECACMRVTHRYR